MSSRSIVIVAFTSSIGIVLFGVGTVWYVNSSALQRLDQARQELRAAFAATTPAQRRKHANACASISETLLTNRGEIGATAAMFAIGTAPVAKVSTTATIPSPSRVAQLSSDDLLLISDLYFNARILDLSDDLLDLLLSRRDEYREQILELACKIRIELGRDAEVLSYCDELAGLNPDSPRPYQIKVDVYRRHAQWDHLVAAAEMATKRMQSVDSRLQIELIDGYIHIGRFDEARREFENLASNYPDLISRLPTVHARLLIQEGQREQAIKVLDSYLETDPADVEALILKGQVLVQDQKYGEGIEVLMSVLKLEPSSDQACFQIGQAYARLKNQEQADRFLERHRKLMDTKVQLFDLEQQAAREPHNVAIRRQLVDAYSSLELYDLAKFWKRAADVAEGK